jgi:hypothetical protein
VRFCIAFILLALLFACKGGKSRFTVDTSLSKKGKNLGVKPDTIAYNYIAIDSLSCNSENCFYQTFKYPVLKKQSKLNDTLKHSLFNFINIPYKPGINFKDFVISYNKANNDPVDTNRVNREMLLLPSEADYIITFKLQANGLAVLQFYSELSGGAHPNSDLRFLNWNTKTDKLITLNDIFINGYKSKLTKIAEKIFRKEKALSETGSLGYYSFENSTFALNNNFFIAPKGIGYFYNNNEIAPYSDGVTELLIPYQSIKNLLRPNTVVSQFIK